MPVLLITGGAGFIGSNLVHRALRDDAVTVVNLDLLTYAGNLENLRAVLHHPRHRFVQGDINDRALVDALLAEHRPDAVLHLAAESHVDRSIDDATAFLRTNVLGTHTLLDAARRYVRGGKAPAGFRYVQVSTDEVFGSLGPTGKFREDSPFAPNSPYAASKASADHLVRAWGHTHKLPVVTTHCSNNYGPYQFPEKLIPLMILNALEHRPLPVYGDGQQVRDWLYVDDHCDGLLRAALRGNPGETYNLGGDAERANLDLVETLCDLLTELAPAHGYSPPEGGYRALISFVTDRPGHDRRYAIDASHARQALGWAPSHGLESGLRATVAWYLEHRAWCRALSERVYDRTRLGTGGAP
jgi:dTDP-glucose 4,6-dehydratase